MSTSASTNDGAYRPLGPHLDDAFSDRFMAAAAVAALKPSTARAFRERIEENLKRPDTSISAAKRAAFESMCDWMRLNEGH